jgi:isocitrate/isopropylmalate dehydrogenase
MAKQILILPGDGVGKEVAASAVEVLDYFISEENLDFNIIETELNF